MLSVFFSYSTADYGSVQSIKSAITGLQVNTFIAEHSINPGQSLREQIYRAIHSCDLFILLWSNNSKNSEWVRHEIGIATGAGKTIVPVLLDRDVLPPSFLKDIKYLSVADDYDTCHEETARYCCESSSSRNKETTTHHCRNWTTNSLVTGR